MVYRTVIAHFFVSEWIWSVTWALCLVPISIICVTISWRCIVGDSMLRAFRKAVYAQLAAWACLTMVSYWAMKLVEGGTSPDSFLVVPQPVSATLLLSFVYTVLQIFFLCLMHVRSTRSYRRIALASFTGNSMAVLIALCTCSYEEALIQKIQRNTKQAPRPIHAIAAEKAEGTNPKP